KEHLWCPKSESREKMGIKEHLWCPKSESRGKMGMKVGK
ncbi:MAG: hypothetical protein K0S25_188, partial [Bacillus sp. (in: firmicutes)]|nr:hypothetical protein [Bacillus sp. (in: firmicutes)]